MSKNFKYIFSLSIVIIIFGCNNSKENDEIKIFYYPNGKVQAIKYFKDSLLSGESFWFYSNGRLKQKLTYIQGKANGFGFFFYESGALESCRIFRDDNEVGYAINYFDKTINIKRSVFYFNDNGQLYFRREFDTLGNIIKEEGKLSP